MGKYEILSKYLILGIIFLIILDLVIKYLGEIYIPAGTSIDALPFLDLIIIYNSGIAFGFLDTGNFIVSTLISLIGIVIVLFLFKLIKQEEKRINIFAFSLIISGALGNIIDRTIDGYVTDLFHLYISKFSFFVFNPADFYISVGAILIIFSEIFIKNENN